MQFRTVRVMNGEQIIHKDFDDLAVGDIFSVVDSDGVCDNKLWKCLCAPIACEPDGNTSVTVESIV